MTPSVSSSGGARGIVSPATFGCGGRLVLHKDVVKVLKVFLDLGLIFKALNNFSFGDIVLERLEIVLTLAIGEHTLDG